MQSETALDQYQRLESVGDWRPAPDAEPREVLLTFGRATLILLEPQNEWPITHWSLSAIRREGQGFPARFTPDEEGYETVEIGDSDMVAAIEAVADAVQDPPSRRPNPRIAQGIFGGIVCAVVLGAIFLPERIHQATLNAIPESRAERFGTDVLSEISAGRGVCKSTDGIAALRKLMARLPGALGKKIAVLPLGDAPSATLPGDIILLNSALLETLETPEAFAGFALDAMIRAEERPAFDAMLREAGPMTTARVLFTGDLPKNAAKNAAFQIKNAAPPLEPVDDEKLLDALALAKLPSLPFAEALLKEGAAATRVEAIRDGDTVGEAEFDPAINDSEWVALQGICNTE
ncbi:hypothetical protein ACMA5I_03640 [Paracoccaceae bacterium GXU_MW_L88]